MTEQADRLARQFEASGQLDIAQGISAWAQVARSRGLTSFGEASEVVRPADDEFTKGPNYLALTQAIYCDRGIVLTGDQMRLASRVVDSALEAIDPKFASVVQLRFGLKDGIGRTYQEVAQELSMNSHRAHNLGKEALSKLAHPLRRAELDSIVLPTNKLDLRGTSHGDEFIFSTRWSGRQTDTIADIK